MIRKIGRPAALLFVGLVFVSCSNKGKQHLGVDKKPLGSDLVELDLPQIAASLSKADSTIEIGEIKQLAPVGVLPGQQSDKKVAFEEGIKEAIYDDENKSLTAHQLMKMQCNENVEIFQKEHLRNLLQGINEKAYCGQFMYLGSGHVESKGIFFERSNRNADYVEFLVLLLKVREAVQNSDIEQIKILHQELYEKFLTDKKKKEFIYGSRTTEIVVDKFIEFCAGALYVDMMAAYHLSPKGTPLVQELVRRYLAKRPFGGGYLDYSNRLEQHAAHVGPLLAVYSPEEFSRLIDKFFQKNTKNPGFLR